jgi:glycosyltransferase involved in cell wall biosynthesis
MPDRKSTNVIFVLGSRFPTEKAYGVTTEYSALAVESIGFEAQIATPRRDFSLQSKVEVQLVSNRILVILGRFKQLQDVPAYFVFYTVVFSYCVKGFYKSRTVCFWTRDILVALILSSRSEKIVICEIHRMPRKLKMIFLKSLAKRKNVILGPIGNFLNYHILPQNENIIILPMSVNLEDLCALESIVTREKVIAYLGSASSSGNHISLDLLSKLAWWLEANYPDWRLEIMGVSDAEFRDTLGKPTSKNLLAFGRISREDALNRLRKAACGLIIYPDTEYFRNSFPIKIVEYAASGLAIIASETESHRRILDEDRCIFFKSNSLDSLCSAVETMISNQSIRLKSAFNARSWVSGFTYTNRVTPAMKRVEDLLGYSN